MLAFWGPGQKGPIFLKSDFKSLFQHLKKLIGYFKLYNILQMT